ncbi:predicted protein [Lachnospiraceae bacterium CAG:215]|nr:predicted protein [Lachnospiraceae bacterium CAG:215]
MKEENRMKEIRMKKGISASELARKIELSERYVRFIENGDKTPSLKTAQKIAEVLEETVDSIFLN